MPEPNPDEFVAFIETLKDNAPDGYEPWLFRCEAQGKNPELSFGSWKDESARLSVADAVEWMEGGGNVGIAATADDRLINVDVDDDEETDLEDVKDTLLVRSRSRTGFHALYFEADDSKEIPNIPTETAGEVRARWQYVVAPGSYVPVEDTSALPADERDMAGYYTVLRDRSPARITYDELPEVFLEYDRGGDEMDVDADAMPGETSIDEFDGEDGGYEDDDRDSDSALFDITAKDVVLNEHGSVNIGDRWEAMFHGSETGANMSFSDKGLINCWRHNVAHNGLQALSVLSEYDGSCQDIGTGKKHSNAGSSCLTREEGAHIWHAWKYAKRNGYIPDDDPVPYTAILYIARERDICPYSDLPDSSDESLPAYAYDGVLSSIEDYDDLNPGRKTTDEFAADSDDSDPIIPSASTDGGSTTVDDGGDGGGDVDASPDQADADLSNDIEQSWEEIRRRFREADDRDEREVPRFDAAMKLYREHDFATLEENDQLYAYDADLGIYNDIGEKMVRKQLTRGLEEQYRAHTKSEILDHIRGRTIIPKDEMGGPSGMIAAENCVIDLEATTSRDHDPEYRFLSRLNCEFDPDATAPRFQQFLEEVVPSTTERQKLQEFAGYTLMHWAMPYHKALFLVGPTASGKSTFLDTIRAMLGQDTVASLTPQQLTSERFAGAELFGKWANIRNDIPASTVKNTGAFKEITAGDPVKAERKRKDPFMFEPTAKHLFAANELPSTETDDKAFYRRVLLVAFPETIPERERDKHLDDKLQSELSGVLNWAIEGLQRLLANGAFTADRSPGQTQDTWQKWADSVTRFKKAAISDGDDDIEKSKLYAAYLQYCREEGIPSDTQHKMTRELKRAGLEATRTYKDGSQSRCFSCIALTSRGEQLLDSAHSDSGDSDTVSDRKPTGIEDWD